MAADLLHRFNIGHRECHDGVLLLYSDVDQKVFIRCKAKFILLSCSLEHLSCFTGNKGEENRLNEHSYASLQPVLEHGILPHFHIFDVYLRRRMVPQLFVHRLSTTRSRKRLL